MFGSAPGRGPVLRNGHAHSKAAGDAVIIIIMIMLITIVIINLIITIIVTLTWEYEHIASAVPGRPWCTGTIAAAALLRRELRGSQGMGEIHYYTGRSFNLKSLNTKGKSLWVVSNSWLDRVLLSIVYMFKPSCRPMLEPPIHKYTHNV